MRLKILLVGFWVVLGACAPVNGDREHAEFLVERGKQELSQSQFQFASQSFSAAQAYDPDNEEARFGHALSETLITYEQISLVVRAAGFGDLVPAAARPGDGMSDEAEMYNRIILGILLPLRDQLASAAAEFDTIRGSDFDFAIDHLPVLWNSSMILNLHGTWREGDVRFVGGLVHGLVGGLDFLFAHELKFDLFALLDYFTAYTGSFEEFDFTPPQLLNVGVHLLVNNPDFLNLLARDADGNGTIDGEELPPRARAHLRQMALDLYAVRGKAQKNPGLFRVEEGQGKVLANLTLPHVLVVSRAGEEPEYGVITIPITEGSEAGVQALAGNLDGAVERVEWKAHVLPMLGVVAVAAAKTISQLELDLSSGVKTVLSLIKSPDTVENLVIGFVPDVIAFDPGAYFDNPVGIRAFLPRWREEGISEDKRSFLFEWECAYARTATAPVGTSDAMLYYKGEDEDSQSYHFTCPDEGIIDSAHFPVAATAPGAAIYDTLKVEKIEADGIASGLPYIVFGDADFDGVLYIKAEIDGEPGENPVGSGSFALADLRTLNALIAQIYDELPSF